MVVGRFLKYGKKGVIFITSRALCLLIYNNVGRPITINLPLPGGLYPIRIDAFGISDYAALGKKVKVTCLTAIGGGVSLFRLTAIVFAFVIWLGAFGMAVEQVTTIDTILIDISNRAQIERRMPKETEVVIVNINPGEKGLRIIIARNENQECLKLQKKISLFNRRDKC